MTVVALVFLGLTAVVGIAGSLFRRVPEWVTAVVAAIFLCGAAVAGAFTDKVHGFALAPLLVLTVLAGAVGGIKAAPLAFRLARRQHAEPMTEESAQPLKGGLIIGLLERLAITAAILARWPEGIAIVMAVKGLARYPELREPHASEQFIIGTFASVLWAIAAGGIGRAMLT